MNKYKYTQDTVDAVQWLGDETVIPIPLDRCECNHEPPRCGNVYVYTLRRGAQILKISDYILFHSKIDFEVVSAHDFAERFSRVI